MLSKLKVELEERSNKERFEAKIRNLIQNQVGTSDVVVNIISMNHVFKEVEANVLIDMIPHKFSFDPFNKVELWKTQGLFV